MTQPPSNPLVLTWLAQLVGTCVIAFVLWIYVGKAGAPLGHIGPEWAHYTLVASLLSMIPSLAYLPTFKEALDRYLTAQRRSPTPDPVLRTAVASKLAIGGALTELPMAFGALYLLMGGEARWFILAVLASIALRASYRPFERLPR